MGKTVKSGKKYPEARLASGKGTNFTDKTKKIWNSAELQEPPTESIEVRQRKRLAGIS